MALDFAGVDTDVPEFAIQRGYVAPESVNSIRELFAAIHRGELKEKTVLAFIIRNNQKRWTEVRYSIARDDDGVPATAFLSFKDKTEQKRIEEIFHFSNTLLDFSRESKAMVVANLSAGSIEYESDNSFINFSHQSYAKGAEQAIKCFIRQTVYDGDKESCVRFFDADRFLMEFNAENYEESLDFRYKNDKEEVRWSNVQTRLMRDSYTGEIKLYLLFTDINEQKLVELDFLRRAHTDSLTGLMDKGNFVEEVDLRLTRPNRDGFYNAIVMIDIDKFKKVKDTLGGAASDQVLAEVARRIKGNLRDNDVIARFDRDVFVALLPAMPSIELIEQRCLRICKNISYEIKEDYIVTGSLGIAVSPEDGKSFNTLLKKANAAVRQAKKKGGNRCARFSDGGIQFISVKNYEDVDVSRTNSQIFARTFGYFDLFIDGEPVYFTGAKEKELLAVLIDRNGGTLTSEEAISILWPDEPAGERQLARYRKVAMRLKNTLQKFGIDDILVVNHGVRNIDVSKIECDYYKFLKGDEEFRKLFSEAYMLNYGWAEETTAMLVHLNN